MDIKEIKLLTHTLLVRCPRASGNLPTSTGICPPLLGALLFLTVDADGPGD